MMDSVSSNSLQVQGSNDSSIVSKLSMVNHGYHNDAYYKFFVKKASRRSPLINRGYYIRAKTASYIISQFFSGVRGKKQVISLGAGFDTTYFWSREKFSDDFREVIFVEIDYPEVMKRKVNLAKSNDLLKQENTSLNFPHVIYSSQDYLALGYDLRDVGVNLSKLLSSCDVDFDCPTLFVSEVVLTYLTGSQSSRILSWVNHSFKNAFMFIYEQMLPDDGFGHVMCRHFETLGSPLSSINDFPTLCDHEARHSRLGFQTCTSTDMHTFYMNLPPKERERIEQLELFDEYEGWHQKCLHYFALCSTNSTSALLKDFCSKIFANDLRKQNTCEKPLEIKPTLTHTWNNSAEEKEKQNLQLFGHSYAIVKDNTLLKQKALIVGGFGIPAATFNLGRNQSHQRLDVIILDVKTGQSVECLPLKSRLTPLLFSSLSRYSGYNGGECYVMFGGRTSPKCPSNDVQVITLSVEKDEMTQPHYDCQLISTTGESPFPRWRHSATLISDGRLIVFGGRSKDTVFNDCWMLNLPKKSWESVKPVSGKFVVSRHSHSTAQWKSNVLVTSGGLDGDHAPLHDVLMMEFDQNSGCNVKRLNIVPPLEARYSHTSHIIDDDILLLVGGVKFPKVASQQIMTSHMLDNVAVVNLKTFTWVKTVVFPGTYCNRPIRIHCHVSEAHYCRDTGNCRLTIIGGGSNCFSFGTHFNKTPIVCEFPILYKT
ncbi:unnamed protein product [Clavelina lepadiformis]|uniref:tRNA wybutosine-synthesizing protein 4 n=1 Tax=Clavelina lepadiformis TaxID=159417 RepID=A0ABP0F4G9_CLALP